MSYVASDLALRQAKAGLRRAAWRNAVAALRVQRSPHVLAEALEAVVVSASPRRRRTGDGPAAPDQPGA